MELLSSISNIKGVGDKTEKLLNNLGVYTIEDILLFFPRTYLVYPEVRDIDADSAGSLIAFAGKLKTPGKAMKTRRGMVTSMTAFSNECAVELVWFNMPYIKSSIEVGKTYIFYGKLEIDNRRFKMIHPEVFSPDKYELQRNEIQPVYPLTKGLSNNTIKKIVRTALDECTIPKGRLPLNIEKKYDMYSYEDAVKKYHFPIEFDELVYARRRLAFEELFFFILNARLQEDISASFPNNFNITHHELTERVKNMLPYELTMGQNEALNEVLNDLQGKYISQRLIQGDVGSGKTIVAFLAMLDVCLSGYQSALMAPTEVLARQHFENFTQLCERYNIDIPVALFLGSQKASEKKAMQKLVDENPACFIIGTHALISEGRNYSNLAFVITDEQHRFGVKQREKLSLKGNTPHMLVMSATPIPRTLAMILYGNMHVSTIKELPAERLPIKTCVIKESKRAAAYKFVTDEVNKGHQVYIICPLVEASETTEAENVSDYSTKLVNAIGTDYKLDILHGKMKADQKNEVMERFALGETQILISTTVVEVGVNVPNATVIMIENANRFGLAALHQLRGRVGRGKDQSYCILMNSSSKNGDSERLDIMLKSNDGFYIASEDLKLRGPGDFFGIRQSGEFSFKIADIYNDADDVKNAADEVDNLLNEDHDLSNHKEILNGMNLFLAKESYVL